MTYFYNERVVKAVRKPRPCCGCCRVIEYGDAALVCAGISQGCEFWSGTYHADCREAEARINDLHDWRYNDEWILLSEIEVDDWPVIIAEYPHVAARMGITTERYDGIQEERRRVRLAFSANRSKA